MGSAEVRAWIPCGVHGLSWLRQSRRCSLCCAVAVEQRKEDADAVDEAAAVVEVVTESGWYQ